MSNNIHFNNASVPVFREIEPDAGNDGIGNRLYNLIKKIAAKIFACFYSTKSHNKIIQTSTTVSLADYYSFAEITIDQVPSKRNELKKRLDLMQKELTDIQSKLVKDRLELEKISSSDNPQMSKDDSKRLGRAQFETYLLEDHPKEDNRNIHQKVNRAIQLSDKIASLESDLEAYDARLENYNIRTTTAFQKSIPSHHLTTNETDIAKI